MRRWGKIVLSGEKSEYKGPEVEISFVQSMKGKASGTGAQRKRGKVRGTQIGEGTKGQACRALQVVRDFHCGLKKYSRPKS